KIFNLCSGKQVDVQNIQYDISQNRLALDLSKDQACVKDDLTVQLTTESDDTREYKLVNGEYAHVSDKLQCAPCKVIVKLTKNSTWKLNPSNETHQWFGTNEMNAETNATHINVNWTIPMNDDPIGYSIHLRGSNDPSANATISGSPLFTKPVTKRRDSTTFAVNLCGPYALTLEYNETTDNGQFPVVLTSSNIFVPCEKENNFDSLSVEAAELFKMKRISILPLICTFVVCAVFTLFSIIQYQMEKLQRVGNSANDDAGSMDY
ncbi:hypothetical protein D915_008216, partial [Fasciola hepatica]